MNYTDTPLWYLTLVIITTILLGLSAVVLMAAKFGNSGKAAKAGRYMIWVASLVAAPVVIIGFSIDMDFRTDNGAGSELQWALLSSVVFWLLAVWSVRDAYEKNQPNLAFVIIAAAALLSVMVTGYKSGKSAFSGKPGIRQMADNGRTEPFPLAGLDRKLLNEPVTGENH